MSTEPQPIHDQNQDVRTLRQAFLLAAAFVGLLWLIKITELILGLHLVSYGVFPRQASGLVGIALSPLLHGSIAHLLANTSAVLLLGTALMYGYPKAARIVLPILYLGSGFGVWLFARPAFHIGASGLTFGMMFFVFTIGALRWDRRAIALSLSVFLLYGGMIWGVLPSAPRISFEYHLAGAVIGITLAYVLRGLDPPPPEKTYSWEGDDTDDDWPIDDGREEPDRPGDGERVNGAPHYRHWDSSGL